MLAKTRSIQTSHRRVGFTHLFQPRTPCRGELVPSECHVWRTRGAGLRRSRFEASSADARKTRRRSSERERSTKGKESRGCETSARGLRASRQMFVDSAPAVRAVSRDGRSSQQSSREYAVMECWRAVAGCLLHRLRCWPDLTERTVSPPPLLSLSNHPPNMSQLRPPHAFSASQTALRRACKQKQALVNNRR